jgi:hypothetical protein
MSLSIANTVARTPMTARAPMTGDDPMRAQAGGAAMPGRLPRAAAVRAAAALDWLTDADLARESAQLAALQAHQRRGTESGPEPGAESGAESGAELAARGGRTPPVLPSPAAGPALRVPQTLQSLFRDG